MGNEVLQIPEIVVENHRLGRHVRHDVRSLRYPFRAPTVQLVSKRWSTGFTPVLDQGNLGSCTGNATVGALLCDNDNPLHNALSAQQTFSLNESLAVAIYSEATTLDPWPGSWEPDDTGSDGLSVAKSAKNKGYISGYSHALSYQDALAALTTGPVIVGINWYAGFDNPSASGEVAKTGELRGGHEICFDEIDVENSRVWFRNSWSSSWGVAGRAWMSFDTFKAILSEDGDVTVFTPLSAPEPTPIPTPTPDPTPTPTPDDGVTDQDLYDATTVWVKHKKVYKPNEVLRQIIIKWRSKLESDNA